jgi:hypothetical protein
MRFSSLHEERDRSFFAEFYVGAVHCARLILRCKCRTAQKEGEHEIQSK